MDTLRKIIVCFLFISGVFFEANSQNNCGYLQKEDIDMVGYDESTKMMILIHFDTLSSTEIFFTKENSLLKTMKIDARLESFNVNDGILSMFIMSDTHQNQQFVQIKLNDILHIETPVYTNLPITLSRTDRYSVKTDFNGTVNIIIVKC